MSSGQEHLLTNLLTVYSFTSYLFTSYLLPFCLLPLYLVPLTFLPLTSYCQSLLFASANGVLVSMVSGKTLAYALFSLQERGRLFIEPNVDVYEGQIMGLHSRGNDLVVNPTKAKQLTNVRASGTDEAVILTPPVLHSLEQALEFIDEDELVEVTPDSIRLRKKLLLEHERKRASRNAA